MKSRGRREKCSSRRWKPRPRVPALDAETLEDFLNGQLEGEERARVLAILKNLPDHDFVVFTEAAAVLRELEHKGLAARLRGWVARIINRLGRKTSTNQTDPPHTAEPK